MKVTCTVWMRGKDRDNINVLPIHIIKKLDKLKEMEEKAKSFFAQTPELDADGETKITLFLQAVKGTNIASLSQFTLMPVAKEAWEGYRFFHNQFYRDLELVSLLTKATKWSLNPFVYTEASILNSKFALQTQIYKFMMGASVPNRTFVEYLALSHAIMTAISFIRLLPPDRQIAGPFWLAIQDIEKNNEVQQQVQVRLLKDEKHEMLPLTITEEEKEQIVYEYRQIVEGHFSEFLTFLTTSR